LRAFTDVPDERLTALGLPKGRAVLAEHRVITDLGADTRSLHDQTALLFDLGLGTSLLRVAIRTADQAAAERIGALTGHRFNDVVGRLVDDLTGVPLVVVSETVLTRLETTISAAELPILIAEARDPQRRMVLPAGLVPAWAATMLVGLTAKS
jgi:hypothetical protein